MNEQIEQLMSQLDSKIESLNTTRTDPDTIANAIANNLQGFVSTIVANFLRSKREEELELAKPREVIKEPTPINIVSVSRTAAGQIAAALEAAGIGKYNLKINQTSAGGITEEQSEGLMSKIMKIAAGAAAIVLGAVIAFGKPLSNWISSIAQSIKRGFIEFVGFLEKIPVIGSIIEGFDITGQDPEYNEAMNKLSEKKSLAENDPESFLRGDAGVGDITSAMIASSTGDFINTVDKFNKSDAPTDITAMDSFLQETPAGQMYTQQMIAKSGREEIVDAVNQQAKQLESDYNMLFDDDPEMRAAFLKQATTEQGITAEFIEDNQDRLKNKNISATDALVQLQQINNLSTGDSVRYTIDNELMDQKNITTEDMQQMIRQATQANMQDVDYFSTQQGLDMLLADDSELQKQFDELVNKTGTAGSVKPVSTPPPDVNTPTSQITPESSPPPESDSTIKITEQPPEPMTIAPPASPAAAPQDDVDISQLVDLLDQENVASNEKVAMLQSILEGLQQRDNSSTYGVPPITPQSEDFSAEHVRKQWRTSPLGTSVASEALT